MEHTAHDHRPDCFSLAELEVFQSLEGAVLTDVNYYLWLNQNDSEGMPYRFLYFLELLFDAHLPLMLTSGEDSAAVRISDAETLVKTADVLQKLHGQISIQRVSAAALPLWQPLIGHSLEAVRLSKNEEGMYYNDALLLDFGTGQVLVALSGKEGLVVDNYGRTGSK
jgi:hypothetical protein